MSEEDPTASIHGAATPEPGQSGPVADVAERNPYLIALIVFTAIFAVIAVILYIVGSSENSYGQDPDGQLSAFVAAGTWSSFAGVSFLATMIVGGINWHMSRLNK